MSVLDRGQFDDLVQPHRRELLVHCYRMLGSLHDAEDSLQEALVRAWRGIAGFEGRASLRSWLYRIATHTSLDVIARRRPRSLPLHSVPAGDPADAMPAAALDPIWIDPIPDDLVADEGTPEVTYTAREAVALAFLAAVQLLPARQRAVLILRDVLGFSAAETAEMLDVTVVAVNSALQRARAILAQHRASPADCRGVPDDDELRSLLGKYVSAWESGDAGALIRLIQEDAAFSMPPLPLWFRGREAIRSFAVSALFAGPPGSYRARRCRANGCPAIAIYHRGDDGRHVAAALDVLVVRAGQIAEIHAFLAAEPGLFAAFGLPATLE